MKKSYKIQDKYYFQGIPISIENRKGTYRSGVDSNGNGWSIKMLADYGYIRLTEGTDGDHLDVYIGPNSRADAVYIFHMNNPDTGKYDEDKVFLGFDTDEDVEDMLNKQYDRPGYISGNMTMLTMPQFKTAIAKKQNRGKPIVFCPKDVKKSVKLFINYKWHYGFISQGENGLL